MVGAVVTGVGHYQIYNPSFPIDSLWAPERENDESPEACQTDFGQDIPE